MRDTQSLECLIEVCRWRSLQPFSLDLTGFSRFANSTLPYSFILYLIKVVILHYSPSRNLSKVFHTFLMYYQYN